MKLPDVDDWLPELPPLDGAEGEDDSPTGQDGSEDLDIPGSAGDGRDDGADDTLDIGETIEIDGPERTSSGGDEQGDDHDREWDGEIGGSDLVGDDSVSMSDDDSDTRANDLEYDLGDDLDDNPSCEDGEVGPSDSIESMIDDELPPMDADDDGDFEDELLREADVAIGIAPPRSQHSLDLAWREVESVPLPLPVEAEDLDASVLLDPELHDSAILVTSRQGVGRAVAGRAISPCNLWRELGGSAGALPLSEPFLASLWASGPRRVLWLATPSGRLLRGDRNGSRWEERGPLPGTGFCALATRADGAIALLRRTGGELSLVSSNDARSWSEQDLELTGMLHEERRPWLALSGSALALGHLAGVALSRDGGRTFRELPGSAGAVAGVFAGQGANAPLIVALLHADQPRVILARTDERDVLELVAQVDPGSAEDNRAGDDLEERGARPERLEASPPLALLWDGIRGLAWVWWNNTVTAWGPRSLQ